MLTLCLVALTLATPILSFANWDATIKRVRPAIVSIQVDHPRAFDEKWNSSSQATGFVVDAQRGLILTNRHVVGPGPATARAIFDNKEEVALVPVYRDPVHDFGFFKYNPAALKRIKPPSLKLKPSHARQGLEIRLLGNDAGERLSILDGTIALLDRNAPNYGKGRYNDFNTYYYQAASGSSGGSSGSPVINKKGHVVALNAGGKRQAATSYFLPLHQVVRALAHLQNESSVPRGSLQTTFVSKPLAEISKLGVDPKFIDRSIKANPKLQSLLVVEHVIPASSASHVLKVGDVLVSIGGNIVQDFYHLAEHLDQNLNQQIELCVDRAGEQICAPTEVTNLADITPQSYIELGGAVLHSLSYQRARHFNRNVAGVYLADPGFAFAQAGVPKGALITQVNNHSVENLDDLQSLLKNTKLSTPVNIKYRALKANQVDYFAAVNIEQQWFPTNHCSPKATIQLWQCNPIILNLEKRDNNPPILADKGSSTGLVYVEFALPYGISGHNAGMREGTGIVVDAKRGLVLTSRTIVISTAGYAHITFAGTQKIPANVVALHPTHNYALLQFEPDSLGDYPITQVDLEEAAFSQQNEYTVIGLDREQKPRTQQVQFAERETVQFPISRPPRFQNTNTELLQFVNGPKDFTGLVLDQQGKALALYQKFDHTSENRTRTWYRGVDNKLANQFINAYREGWYDLGTGWYPITTALVHQRGVPPGTRFAAEQKFFELFRLTKGSIAAQHLDIGDILLAVDEQPVTSIRDLELWAQKDTVNLKLIRQAQIVNKTIPTTLRPSGDLQQVVYWSGALFQSAPLILARERQVKPHGAYISFYRYGSPAARAKLFANLRVVAVNEQPTPSLETFREAVATIAHGTTVRIKTLDLDDKPNLLTLTTDLIYWPGYTLDKTPQGWIRNPIP